MLFGSILPKSTTIQEGYSKNVIAKDALGSALSKNATTQEGYPQECYDQMTSHNVLFHDALCDILVR